MAIKPLIAHLRSTEFYGGPEHGIAAQTEYVDDFRWMIITFTGTNRSREFHEAMTNKGIDAFEISAGFWQFFRSLYVCLELLKSRNVAILVTHDYKSDFFGLILKILLGVDWIPHFHGFTADSNRVKIYNYLHGISLRFANTLLSVSAASKNTLISRGINARRIRIMPNAIARSRIDSEARFVTDRFTTAKCFRFAAVGRMSREKGFEYLIRACEICNKEGLAFSVDFFGDGPLLSNLRGLVSDCDLANIITFHGHIDDILPRIRHSHCLVVPSLSEGMPNVILEAWGQGIPVIASSVGGVPEMVDHRGNGLLVVPERPDLLARAISEIANSPELAAQLGHRGWTTVQTSFTYDVQYGRLKDIYLGVIRESAGANCAA